MTESRSSSAFQPTTTNEATPACNAEAAISPLSASSLASDTSDALAVLACFQDASECGDPAARLRDARTSRAKLSLQPAGTRSNGKQ